MMTEKEKSYLQNWISLLGIFFSVVCFVAICFMIILDFITKTSNPYLEAFTYLLVPAFLIVSLLLIPIGLVRERKRRGPRGGHARRLPALDLNDPVQQKWFLTTAAVLTLFGLFSIFGAWRTYEFTESVAFCGLMCHKVMEPEYTAYQHSSHARVACVQCHIGPGAEWFVRAKLSGMYQIYSTIANKYHRPIETPIKNLRPAQETCEQCHWPQHFFGAVQQDHTYFLSDELNSPWKENMLMLVGGGPPRQEGIHWHMNIKNKIEYIASDDKRQVISWVRRTNPEGQQEIYVNEESGVTADKPPQGEVRRMDCVDCHNRPSHIYKAPTRAVNEEMAAQAIDPALPYIKREAVKALVGEYTSADEAAGKIRSQLETFYREKYPVVWNQKRKVLDHAIDSVIRIYRNNFFPGMKVSWKEYPDNIGHMIFPGCFRCHDGKHKSSSGKVILNDCSKCHHIIEQGKPEALEKSVEGLPFQHPGGDETWKEMACTECHTGE